MKRDNRSNVPFERSLVPQEDVSRSQTSRSITINGRRHLVHTDSISHDELVRLAYPDRTKVQFDCLTVSYRGGPLLAEEGLLGQHQRTRIANGETFNVAATTAS